MDPNAALARLAVVSLQVTTALTQSRSVRHIPAHRVVGEGVPDFIARLKSQPRLSREAAVKRFVKRTTGYGRALIEGSTVFFFYHGQARRVSVTGELNEWNPAVDVMSRVPGTNFHYLFRDVPRHARIEYKIAVDSTLILDPYNNQQAIGGSGPNSEVTMPDYHHPGEVMVQAGTPCGEIEAIEVTSTMLKRTHPVFIYRPYGYQGSQQRYPSLYVMDGGDYLSLGMMATILDNMISARRIKPLVAIFVDPRTDITRTGTNKRTTDYTMSSTFVNFLARELRPVVERKYRLSISARNRGIMGASLGGLMATYAAWLRPDVFSRSAAQSPSYWWKKGTIIPKISRGRVRPVRFYLDTGTIGDTMGSSRAMRDVLQERGYRYSYAEYPEGHNWGNWRARIPKILEYFWGLP